MPPSDFESRLQMAPPAVDNIAALGRQAYLSHLVANAKTANNEGNAWEHLPAVEREAWIQAAMQIARVYVAGVFGP